MLTLMIGFRLYAMKRSTGKSFSQRTGEAQLNLGLSGQGSGRKPALDTALKGWYTSSEKSWLCYIGGWMHSQEAGWKKRKAFPGGRPVRGA